MSVDSRACFEERVNELELGAHLARLFELGWTTHGRFAFSSDYVPGSGDSTQFNLDVVIPVLGRDDHPDKALLRRLFFDSYTLSVNELRRRLERSSDLAPLPVPDVEREKRRQRVQDRLRGLRLEGELEPSHKLQDLAFAWQDRNRVQPIAWEQCTKRESEAVGQTVLRQWKADSSGIVRETETTDSGTADLRSDLLLTLALRRRGVALEMANVMSYDTHELLVDLLMREYLRVPLSGYGKLTYEQLSRADSEFWRQMGLATRICGVRMNADGKRPLDEAAPTVLNSYDFRVMLVPLQTPRAATSSNQADGNAASKRKVEQQAAEIRRLKAKLEAPGPTFKGKGSGSGGQKGKASGGKGKHASRHRLPLGLIGKSGTTATGEPLCYSYNLPQGCSGAPAGSRCPKGWHKCAEPGCNADHGLQSH